MNAFAFLALVAFALASLHAIHRLNRKLRILMASQAELSAAIANLAVDVKSLAESVPAPVDLQPQVDAVNAIDAAVKAATPAPVVP